jgi:hypothetical protein
LKGAFIGVIAQAHRRAIVEAVVHGLSLTSTFIVLIKLIVCWLWRVISWFNSQLPECIGELNFIIFCDLIRKVLVLSFFIILKGNPLIQKDAQESDIFVVAPLVIIWKLLQSRLLLTEISRRSYLLPKVY